MQSDCKRDEDHVSASSQSQPHEAGVPRQRGASDIKHPTFAATRRYLKANPLPQQTRTDGA
jgi:hypothetical protein